ncbi:MAG: M12 family metallo-peptidase [Planctomycetota bacterium]
MRHAPLIRSRFLGAAALVLLAAGTAVGQVNQSTPTPRNLRAAGSEILKLFEITRGTLQDLVSLPKANVDLFGVGIFFGGKVHYVDLFKHDVRADDFKLVVADNSGSQVVPTPPCVTYRGFVREYPNSVVAASLVGGRLQAIIRLDDDKMVWGIQPVSEAYSGIGPATHISYESIDNVPGKHTCGVQHGEIKPLPSFRGPLALARWICEIAIDADNSYYRQNGSNTTNTQNDVTTVINNVAAIYKRDVSIDYKITQIIVRTTAVYSGTVSLTVMSNRWRTYHSTVRRDVTHLFTGRSLGGTTIGLAWLASICSPVMGYGASKSRYTSNLTQRTGLTAHELGHNWSAPHCNGQNPCNIMCNQLGGCNGGLTAFGTYSKNFIIAHRNSRGCLSVGPPSLTGIQPPTTPVFPLGSVTLLGSGLTTVTKVNFGSVTIPASQINIASDSRLSFQPPRPTSLSPVLVNAENSAGKSNNVTLNWRATGLPTLIADGTTKPGGTMLWQYGAGPSNLWFLTVSPAADTVPFLGFAWLKTPILITSGTLDAVGYGRFSLGVPTSTAIGLKVYSQVVTLNPTLGAFAGNTNVYFTTTVK